MKRRRLTAKQKAEIIAKQCGLCHCGCGLPLDGERVEWDHQIPLALGGSDTLENMQALIRSHHAVKTKDDVKRISKAKRMERYHATGRSRARKGPPMQSRGFSGWRKFNGELVERETRSGANAAGE